VPHLREQGSGNIFNIASIGGYIGNFPGWGVYCATKFAVAGLTEALAAEVKPFGVKATVVYPGYFRTNFLAKGSVGVPANPIAVYAEARALQALHQNDINGNQPNDPEKAADALMQVAAAENPPVHLFLGQDAWEMAGVKNDIIHRDLRQWEALTRSTAFTAPVHNP
jgi:NAD(P)-dependent dehydrogenase (short-subunit alcohol dehydrogenase family)